MSMDLCRPFLSSAPGEGSDFDLGGGGGGSGISGPTHLNRSCMMMMNMSGETYNGAAYLPGCCGGGEPVDATRKLMQQQQQPFDMSNTSTRVSLSKSPGGMTSAGASMGFFPFTNAQWKELERQAMVFKYMMHSIPVPYELLFPFITATNPSDPPGMRSDSHLLKFLRNGDPEPGRCRRTDGKKWRCSNAVALDQKYCEKHVHRGRPRSRKHVEAASDFNKSNKKPCLAQNQPTTFPAPPASKPISDTQNAACLDSDQLFRSSALQIPHPHLRNGDLSEDQWNQLRMPDLSSYSTTNPFQQHQQLRLSSYNTPPKPEFNLFLNPDLKKQPLIDAWTASDNPTSNQNHELISLGLSMGHGYSEYGEKQPQIGSNWLSQSGGPLGEVLRPPSTHPLPATSSLTTAAEDNSCNNNNKNSAHVSSSPPSVSPTRVLQRAVSTLSDSTSYSSPALVTFPSQPRSGFQWLNQDKLLKQSST